MLELYNRTLHNTWRTAGNKTQYALQVEEDSVFLSFQGSVEKEDWKANFDFFATPYRDMAFKWYAHRGFLNIWKAIDDEMLTLLTPYKGKKLYILGYSHGAALATLAHEFFQFHGFEPTTYAFAAPRVLWFPGRQIKERFNNFIVVRNHGDVVTHVPFNLMGYFHVGAKMLIGKRGTLLSHLPHYPERYIEGLKIYNKQA